MKHQQIRVLTQYALFTAIIFLLGLTPLGFLYLPIAAITTVHLPVILGGFFFGVKGGAILGGMFGFVSFLRCFTTPDATAAVMLGTDTGFGLYNLFLILMVLFLPRILTGVFSALTYKALKGRKGMALPAMGIAAFVGSMTNTVFYLGGLYLFAFQQTANSFGMAQASPMGLLQILLGVVALNGVVEAVAAVVICMPVGAALGKFATKLSY